MYTHTYTHKYEECMHTVLQTCRFFFLCFHTDSKKTQIYRPTHTQIRNVIDTTCTVQPKRNARAIQLGIQLQPIGPQRKHCMQLVITKFQLNSRIGQGVSFWLQCMYTCMHRHLHSRIRTTISHVLHALIHVHTHIHTF